MLLGEHRAGLLGQLGQKVTAPTSSTPLQAQNILIFNFPFPSAHSPPSSLASSMMEQGGVPWGAIRLQDIPADHIWGTKWGQKE